jgi:hypothetical protein
MPEQAKGPKYDDEYLQGVFGMTSAEILATGVSVQMYIVRNGKKALRNPKARAIILAKYSPAERAQENWRHLALRAYVFIFLSFGLLIVSTIPAIEHSAGDLVEALRDLAGVGILIVFGFAVPAFRSYFRYVRLNRAENRDQGRTTP